MADTELAVDVPVTDDEIDDDEALRAQAAVNSPKNKQDMNFDDDENNGNGLGMSLNLADVPDDDDDGYDDKVTPNTKRDQMDVNSPRNKHKQNWDNDEAASTAAVAGLVTQVPRNTANAPSSGGGVESLVTQVPRDDDETERNIINEQQQKSGICACFSCLWSCCSGPQRPADVAMSDQGPSNNNKEAVAVPKSKGNETADSSLLAGNGNGREAKNEQEDSFSSTEYPQSLLPPPKPEHVGKKCLVLDLDETLVHSSFKPIPKPDFIIPVEIDRVVHHVYVLKRPYVDEFLLRASKHYEIVIFTASLSKYADPLLDKLDIHNVITGRLFRESCVIHGTAYVKDMRRIGRKLKDTIIVDNSPPSYLFQPTNAVPIASWFDDQSDTQLLDFCPVIESTMKDIDDVRKLLDANNKSFRWLCNQAHQPLSKYTVRNDQVNRH